MFGRKKVEQTLALEDIDPTVCQQVLKGEVDSYGRCVVRAILDPGNPNRIELRELKLIESGPRRAPPVKGEKE